MDINDLLTFTKENEASDLHISVGSPVMIRINGKLKQLDLPRELKKAEIERMLHSILNDDQRDRFERDYEVDFSYGIEGVARFRVNIYSQIQGIAGAFRTIPEEVRSFDELGLPATVLEKLSMQDKGLILLTGPTGSGKTTTLAAMVEYINQNKESHIITIEDPVEYFHYSQKCLINQRELGTTTHSFSNALRAGLREDPDVILVGEMRDLDTVSLALTAAETGHLVLSTVHTSGAPKTIHRIIDIFPPAQQPQIRSMFSETIEAVINQKLLVRKDGRGRVVACEVMLATPAIRNLIRENKIYEIPSIVQAGSRVGMQTLDDDLRRLVVANKITKAEAAKVADDPEWFLR